MLFQIDLSGSEPREVFPAFWSSREADDDLRKFAEGLVLGVEAERAELDRLIARAAEHWRIERMAVVDRNVLRVAAYEMTRFPETPPAVVIDEAIEVAKKYGSEESGAFINGILDSVRRGIEQGRSAPDRGESA